MSYRTWSYNGYGICIDDYLDKIPNEKVLEFVKKSKKVEDKFNELMEEIKEQDGLDLEDENDLDDAIVDAIDNYECETCLTGLGAILYDVMNDCEEGLRFNIVDDFDGNEYVLLLEGHPWYMTERELKMTPEKLDAIFKKYCDELIEGDYEIDYYEVSNGG